jgi:uncharacterized protein YndB with AHSA1/START domain
MATTTAPQTTSLQVRRTFAAPREKVFRAWTDPQTLKQWFGPPGYKTIAAEVDLRKGGAFRITMQKADGDPFAAFGTFQEVQPPEHLVYIWNWTNNDIGETIVTLDFRDAGGETEVVLTHERFEDVKQRDRHNSGWIGCYDKLEQFLDAAQGELVVSVDIAASPERVFNALASKEVCEWWVRPGVFDTREWSGDVRAGGRWRAAGIGKGGNPYALEGEFLEVDAPRKLVHTWHLVGAPGAPTTVSYLLEKNDGGTRLTLRHSGFVSPEACASTSVGWETSLERLVEIL